MQSLACGSPAASAPTPTYPSSTGCASPAPHPGSQSDARSRRRGQPFSAGRDAPKPRRPRSQDGSRDCPPASRPPAGAPIPLPSRRSLRILLVDDSAVHRKIALGILHRVGLQADVAADGREAIACLARATYDLVLMDCEMPVMDGYATTRLIRDPASPVRDHSIPVIALTAHTSEADRCACFAAGMDDFVPKPLTSFAMVVTIKRWSVAGAAAS